MFRITHRSLTAAAGGLALLAMLAACAAPADEEGKGGDSKIATLETGSPAPTASADPLFAKYGEPVRERLDMTDEEGEAAWKPRDRCVADHTSAPQGTSEQGGGGSSAAAGDAEAEAICSRLAPLPPWQLDAQNPDALRFVQQVVDCLREHGVREVEIGEADQFGRIGILLGGESNDSSSISLGMQHTDACMAAASEEVAP
ncbi:hypothetical protein [Agreia sp. VKM Ac-1783]|uniref:hypothetical protein n=1 Tax=Agreia sp. VKM Ac-1783 TaxID=1938889 RepID=UPI000A2ACE9C|nr:hypothetical protein [Agreia sp. VKM Ac-1783]SMQ74912.1 hypothetical protein SAMN06295943_3310 [Agreia sp. VKM Ac-1783]